MKKSFRAWVCLLTAASLSTQGCRTSGTGETGYQPLEAQVAEVPSSIDIDDPNVETEDPYGLAATVQPISIADDREPEYWDLSLQQSIEMALARSEVMRDLGGQILRSPLTIRTVQDPAITETDPRFGVDAALSQFDTQFTAAGLAQNNDRAINNVFAGGGTRIYQQDFASFITGLSKRAATGAEFTVRNNTEYDANNSPGNQFPSVWNTNIETIVRQPLLQGGGVDFNRIYGPNGTPGLPSGVLLARVNTDQTVADFELGVRNFVSDVENAYWDLYFAYRDLAAKQEALDNALQTWERAKARVEEQPEQEPLAREQYYRFHSELQDSLSGKLGQRTQNNNGTTGGTVRGFNGVQVAERRLRLLIGDSVNSRVLLRPVTEPNSAPLIWDWNSLVTEALQNRPELRQQRLAVKRRQLELLASRNFLAPRLDAIGRYRVRGLGHNLAGGGSDLIAGPGSDTLDSAVNELGTFDHQEWELGVEFSVPLGYRRGHAAVQHAELQIARELAILHEQERQVVHDLSNAKTEMERAHEQREINRARWLAARDAERILLVKQESGVDIALEMLLDAQRRKLEAETAFHLAAVEYEIAEKNVHLEKGSILSMHSVLIDNPLSDSQNPLPGELQFVLPPLEESAATPQGPGLPGALPPVPRGSN